MAKPPSRDGNTFEKVKLGEFIFGVISDIKYDPAHKKIWQGKEKVVSAVQIRMKLDGYEYPHGTPWLTFSYAEKARLYINFIAKLVEGATPDMDFDLDCLRGMKVKTIWGESPDGKYQNLDNIYPVEGKVKAGTPTAPHEEEPTGEQDEEIPF